jgi:hypothetical protein
MKTVSLQIEMITIWRPEYILHANAMQCQLATEKKLYSELFKHFTLQNLQ